MSRVKQKVINFFAGPGSGKSTRAAALFADLKQKGISCELVTEFAKDLTWEKRHTTLEDQLYVMAKQAHRLWRLRGQTEYIITDSPLPLAIIYGINMTDTFRTLVMEQFNMYENKNYFVTRTKPYCEKGRNQTLSEAMKLDGQIVELLVDNNIKFLPICSTVAESPIYLLD